MDTLKYEAERLRLGIRGGWIDPRAAIAWADEEIARQRQPEPVLIDISLAVISAAKSSWHCSPPCPGRWIRWQ